jgi:tRNA 5-methylaminomethyl-2-thiouridine biosynthesis bifunctional protein
LSEQIEWLPDGTPFSPRFGDRYRSESGGLSQAQEVFLHGCGLPAAWAQQPHWCILETGFGLGLNFLVTWAAWKADPQRPQLLHFVSIEAWPASADDLLRSFAAHPALRPLAEQLHVQWRDLLPGFHRLIFEGGRVQLTLCIGDAQPMLRDMAFQADSVYLDGFSPQRNPDIWSVHTLKAVSRCCKRGTRIATWTIARAVRDALTDCGFSVQKTPGVPPKRDNLQGRFDPRWEPRRLVQPASPIQAPSECVVIGAGLAGACVAASLALRGWRVLVLDAAETPATGASSLPAGIVSPLISRDNNVHSRLSRSGVRATLQLARARLQRGEDWQADGVLEWLGDAPAADYPAYTVASAEALRQAGLPTDANALWHPHAGWIKPSRLVQALLDHPHITWRGSSRVDRVQATATGWLAVDMQGDTLAEAPLMVVAAAYASRHFGADSLPVQAIGGQVSWGIRDGATLPPFPVNGQGHCIPDFPSPAGRTWLVGASYIRDTTVACSNLVDRAGNLERLHSLLPLTGSALAAQFAQGQVQDWAGTRCASPDRLPMVGALAPGLWVSTAMGSRGLSYAHLCAELLAARLHGEPLPLDKKLAAALDVQRFTNTRG